MRKLLTFLILFFIVNTAAQDYMNPELSIEERTSDLLNRMTLEEKVRQLDMYQPSDFYENDDWSKEKMKKIIGELGIGSIHDFYPDAPQEANDFQKFVIENSRLGIPCLFIEEGLHGYCGEGSTTFPVPMGLASSWDGDLIRKVGNVIASEARSHGVHMILGPVLGLAREPRWGRVEETYGEDPYLVAQMGLGMVKGLQGPSLSNAFSVIAEPKHFGVHSAPEGGCNTAPVLVGERTARSTFLYPFEIAIKKGGAMGIMAAYNEWDGVPCVSNPFLLKTILRDEWNFDGFVLSDLAAIRLQMVSHKAAKTPQDAIINSINSGLDMQFYDYEHELFQNTIINAVQDGRLPEKELDRAVSSVLKAKFKLGLFERPYTNPKLVERVFQTDKNKDLALQAGHKSICLLKNQNNLLPLDQEEIGSIALLGPMSDISALGGYSPRGATGTTLKEALMSRFGDKIEIHHHSGTLPINVLNVIDKKYLRSPQKREEGLLAEYYNNAELKGKPVISRIETNMAPYWHNNSPAQKIDNNNFSVRWNGTISPPYTGNYEIGIITDDKGKLYLDGKLLVNNWDNYELNVMKTKEVYLEAGKEYPIKMEYAELNDFAGIRLKWRLVSQAGTQSHPAITKAVEAAQMADVAIVALGENSEVVGEGKDKSELGLNNFQSELLKSIYETNTPVVLTLINGRPMAINWAAKHIPAIVEAWYAGESGGKAITDVIFGDFNPCGKLPVSIPKNVGQLPVYYNYKPSARGGYVDGTSEPLYCFGHGLSYTEFKYSDLQINPKIISPNDSAFITLKVSNTGSCKGTEVVQLYINDLISSVTTPIKELKGFKRVTLQLGQTKRVKIGLAPQDLSLWNTKMKREVEPGKFKIMVASSSKDIRLSEILQVKNPEAQD